jgi:hypothetical protein
MMATLPDCQPGPESTMVTRRCRHICLSRELPRPADLKQDDNKAARSREGGKERTSGDRPGREAKERGKGERQGRGKATADVGGWAGIAGIDCSCVGGFGDCHIVGLGGSRSRDREAGITKQGSWVASY